MKDSVKNSRSPLLWPLLGLAFLILLNVTMDLRAGEWKFLRLTILDGHLYGLPVDILNQGSRGMLLALGMTLVIATGGIDLAVGSLMAVAGSVAAVLLTRHGVSWPVAIGAALGVTMLGGAASGWLIARLGVQPIVATLIIMVVGRGVARLVTSGEVVLIKHAAFAFLGNGFVFGVPFSVVLVTVLYLAANWFLRKTAFGLFIEAVGDNETASRFAGLAAARLKALAYVFGGFCAGLAGLLATSNIRAADPYRAGENMELDAIFAVVVGGTALTGGRFRLMGSLVGALLLQTLTTTLYNLGVAPEVATVPKAVLIIAVCLMQSEKTRVWLRGLTRRRAA
jgi:simple sugar transport system permease protein